MQTKVNLGHKHIKIISFHFLVSAGQFCLPKSFFTQPGGSQLCTLSSTWSFEHPNANAVSQRKSVRSLGVGLECYRKTFFFRQDLTM